MPEPGHVRRVLGVLGSALSITAVGAAIPATARADDPVVHRVTYTVTAERSLEAGIYYRDVDPPTWADYSHDPYRFRPRAEAALGPGSPWILDVTLIDPDRWAMVAVTQDSTRSGSTVRCELAVDGIVVDTVDGPAGALCSLRHW